MYPEVLSPLDPKDFPSMPRPLEPIPNQFGHQFAEHKCIYCGLAMGYVMKPDETCFIRLSGYGTNGNDLFNLPIVFNRLMRNMDDDRNELNIRIDQLTRREQELCSITNELQLQIQEKDEKLQAKQRAHDDTIKHLQQLMAGTPSSSTNSSSESGTPQTSMRGSWSEAPHGSVIGVSNFPPGTQLQLPPMYRVKYTRTLGTSSGCHTIGDFLKRETAETVALSLTGRQDVTTITIEEVPVE